MAKKHKKTKKALPTLEQIGRATMKGVGAWAKRVAKAK